MAEHEIKDACKPLFVVLLFFFI